MQDIDKIITKLYTLTQRKISFTIILQQIYNIIEILFSYFINFINFINFIHTL